MLLILSISLLRRSTLRMLLRIVRLIKPRIIILTRRATLITLLRSITLLRILRGKLPSIRLPHLRRWALLVRLSLVSLCLLSKRWRWTLICLCLLAKGWRWISLCLLSIGGRLLLTRIRPIRLWLIHAIPRHWMRHLLSRFWWHLVWWHLLWWNNIILGPGIHKICDPMTFIKIVNLNSFYIEIGPEKW